MAFVAVLVGILLYVYLYKPAPKPDLSSVKGVALKQAQALGQVQAITPGSGTPAPSAKLYTPAAVMTPVSQPTVPDGAPFGQWQQGTSYIEAGGNKTYTQQLPPIAPDEWCNQVTCNDPSICPPGTRVQDCLARIDCCLQKTPGEDMILDPATGFTQLDEDRNCYYDNATTTMRGGVITAAGLQSMLTECD